ncbi:MAG: FAD-dependent oxidoreductase [Verrucomicrobia bacterium]|nr:FAD-dependent oxidoreductase [Verrucomicrobiota bacterium]
MAEPYDLVVIGAGPAGESAAELAAFCGHRAVIVEKNRPGGTVTTTGGAPTKTLREAALYLTGFRDRDIYGLRLATVPDVILPTIRKRTREVAELLQRMTADNIAKHNVEYLQGDARLGPDRTLRVGMFDGQELTLHAKAILIASGSRPVRPTNIPFDDPGVRDSDTILALGRIPKDILIVGGGPVGVEYATICHALGARVTLVHTGERLIPMMDGEISRRMDELFRKWDLTVVHGTGVDTVTRTKDDNLEVSLSTGAKVQPDTILFAAGRAANTEGLDLGAAGVETDSLGRIVVDEYFRTSAIGIFAAGDVLGPTLASIAMEQGRAAACHALGVPFEGKVDPTPVSAVYGMPEVAGAGLTEEECQVQGIHYEVGRSEFELIPRGAIAGHGGLLKLLFRKDNQQLIGVHCIGDVASELVGIGQMVIHFRGTLGVFDEVSMNTPTYSYAYKYAAFDGFRRLHPDGPRFQ